MVSVNSSWKKSNASDPIVVGGVTPFTTIDYPGQLAAVLFLQGCPWRCHYCHNSELIHRQVAARISWPSVVELLEQRKTLIDAVVFSGGEPTLQSGLPAAMQQVRRMGFKIGLHTAGTYPDRLKRVLPWIDWVGLDIKASRKHYPEVTGVGKSGESAWESARIVVESGVDYEVRTTVHPRLMDYEKMGQLVDELKDLDIENYAIQECILRHCLSPSHRGAENFSFQEADLKNIATRFVNFELRKSS